MPTDPSRADTAGRVFNDLRALARRQGRSTDELLTLYTLERFLFRMHSSAYADRFILKGGLLLAVYDARRSTRDADLLARSVDADEQAVVALVTEIVSIFVDDGLVFDTERVRSRPIRETGTYSGVRVVVPTFLGKARKNLALDVNFGDPVTPEALIVSFPQLLASETFTLLSYPVETILAEKLTTMIQLGDLNTRERDWADVWRLTGIHDIDAGLMYKALDRTASYRGVELLPVSRVIQQLPLRRQNAYEAWRRRQLADSGSYPEDFTDIVRGVTLFADPLITGEATSQRWDAASRAWIA